MQKQSKPRLVITMGDPAGIGPEIILKSFCQEDISTLPGIMVVGDIGLLRKMVTSLSLPLEVTSIEDIQLVHNGPGVLPVWNIGKINLESYQAARISSEYGAACYRYIKEASVLASQFNRCGIATAPIHKISLHEAGVVEPGHTEILQNLTNVEYVLTMFMVDQLKVFFYSRHLSLKDAIANLSSEKLYDTLVRMNQQLMGLGFSHPRLAMAALNPHSSDGGLFGKEEEDILKPAVKKARNMGIQVVGPIAADSVFHQAIQGSYDAVLSLYHDQGHIACKTYDFERTISVTLGLPYLRTSVDHGTAFDIAGKNQASSVSMREAILCCHHLLKNWERAENAGSCCD